MTVGRPRKAGPRYPCGDLVRDGLGQPPSPAVIKRARDALVLRAADARHGSEVGRLGLMRAITPAQEAAAYHVAAIWGAHDRLLGRRRTVASPSYEIGRAGFGSDVADERIDAYERDYMIARDRATRRVFEAMLDHVPRSSGCRRVLEELCVEDVAVPPGYIERVRWMLDQLAQHFRGIGGAGKKRRGIRVAPAIPTPAQSSTIMGDQPKGNPEWDVFAKLVHALRPDLDEAGIIKAWRLQVALRDRERLQTDRTLRKARKLAKSVNS